MFKVKLLQKKRKRKREGERERWVIYIIQYTYIYIERERDRERTSCEVVEYVKSQNKSSSYVVVYIKLWILLPTNIRENI